jgi:diguanylate cyclase (GGDEF)-like protein/PAS domain S-box-containing protein
MTGTKPSIQGKKKSDLNSLMSSSLDQIKNIDKSQFQILLIDDNINLIHSTKAIVEAYGYKCIIADGGESGLNVLRTTTIDIVLLDLSMPDIDGYEVLETIRYEDIQCEVIVVSGDATFESASKVFRDGALDFLNKPYNPSQLLSIIDSVAYKTGLKRQLKHISQTLKESEKRYRFIVSNSPDIIYMIDHNGFFTFVNDRVYDLLGYRPQDLIGVHFSTLVYDDDLELAKHTFNERCTGDRTSQNIEFRLKCLDRDTPHKSFELNSIAIGLSAMGIHQQGEECIPFLGVYGVARDISERKKAQDLIHFQAYHDLLTKLPNRELFLDRLKLSIAHADRNESKLAVMFLDIDGFKFINDSLGHAIGDSLLQQVSNRIKKILRDSDTVSRIGGDEFSILITELQNRTEAGLVAQKLIDGFNKPIDLENHEINISFSIGISVYPDDASNTDQLIQNADMAMYHIKGRGKNGFEYFSNYMKGIYEHRHTIEQDIRKALDQNQFEAYFQPQYNISNTQIFGLEALIRWNHPEKGLIYPDKFIPVAEEIGLINEIGLFMLETGCQYLREWLDNGYAPIKLSVNVSAYQLAENQFDVIVCNLVKQYRLPPNLLMVEITETTLMLEMETVLPRLKNLVKCGIGICIDDFGVGYSSLSYLQKLPIKILKIDRSFLSCISSDLEKACVIKAIVAMARELQLEVIVEGVETEQQLEYIRKIGCKMVQGFLLGRPAPHSEVTKLLQKNV